MVSNKGLIRFYLLVFIWSLFALNVGQTFGRNNIPFLVILGIGLGLAGFIAFVQAKNFYLNKSIIFYICFVAYALLSTLWATSPQLARTGFFVVALTLLILFIFYFILREANIDINILFGYICLAGIFTYIYLVLKYGISVTWCIRDENFAGADLYNANSTGKLYCLAAICGFIRAKNIEANRCLYIVLSVALSVLMLLSGSKTNLIFAMIFIIIIMFLKQRGTGNKILIILLSPFLICSVYFLVMYVPVLYNAIGYRFIEIFDFLGGEVEKYSSTWYRMTMYHNGINAFVKQPFLGYGMSNASLYNVFEYVYQSGVYLHSNYLELLVDLGIVGTVLYYLIYFYALKWNLYKYKESDEIAMAFIALVVAFMVTDISSVSYLSRPSVILIITACLYGTDSLSREDELLQNNRTCDNNREV